MKPFANPLGIKWIRSCGSLLFALKQSLGILLNIPPATILELYKNKVYFGLFVGGTAICLLPMSVFGFVQMYLFEGASSEKNLRSIMNKQKSLEVSSEKAQWPLPIVKMLKVGMYTQTPVYGFNAAKSPSVLLRYLLKDKSAGTQIMAIVPIAVFQFIFSSLGAQLSEVQEALSNLNEIEERSLHSRTRTEKSSSLLGECCFCLFKAPSQQAGVDERRLLEEDKEKATLKVVAGLSSSTGVN